MLIVGEVKKQKLRSAPKWGVEEARGLLFSPERGKCNPILCRHLFRCIMLLPKFDHNDWYPTKEISLCDASVLSSKDPQMTKLEHLYSNEQYKHKYPELFTSVLRWIRLYRVLGV